MRKGNNSILLIGYIIVWLLLLGLARFLSSCGEQREIKKSQKEMRGETKHIWKGGPHKQNKRFVGYQF